MTLLPDPHDVAVILGARHIRPGMWVCRCPRCREGDISFDTEGYIAKCSAATPCVSGDYVRAIAERVEQARVMAAMMSPIPTNGHGAGDFFGLRDLSDEDAPMPDVADSPTLNEIDAGDDDGPIPPRQWLLGNQFCRRFLSALIAPGSTGKSALRLLQFISLATGRPLTRQRVFRRCRVLLLSFEDDADEMRRRIAAALLHHGIARAELKEWLFYQCPKGLKLVDIKNGSRQLGQLARLLEDAIERRKPDLVAFDPFVKLHALEENDNGAMDHVCDLLATLAARHDIAVDIAHHTRKGAVMPGDPDAGRGASGIRDAGRLVYTLTRMSEDEAKLFGIAPEMRDAYVRLDKAKVNLAPPSRTAAWFRLVGVPLHNGNDDYPNGDDVQTVEPWTPPDTWAGLSSVVLNAALTEIEAGLPDGRRYSDHNRAGDCAAWPIVQRHCPDKTEGQCREIVATWVKNGVLFAEEYENPIDRKTRKGLRLNATKRPS